MVPSETTSPTYEVSPLQALGFSLGVFLSGATIAGGTSFVRSTKKLEEEGISPKVRAKGIPLAMKALGISTCAICTVGAVGYLGLSVSLGLATTAEVSTWQFGLEEIKVQQANFREAFQSQVNKLKERQNGPQ